MSKLLTRASNKVIAEFMGGKYNKDLSFDIGSMEIWLPIHGVRRMELLKYHKSWNWLMPVIAKIGEDTGYELVSGYSYSYWNKLGENPIQQEFCGNHDVVNLYRAVVPFLTWYNQNTEPCLT